MVYSIQPRKRTINPEELNLQFGSTAWILTRLRYIEKALKEQGIDIEERIKQDIQKERRKEIEEEKKSKKIQRENIKILKKVLKKKFQPLVSYNPREEPKQPVGWDAFKEYRYEMLIDAIPDIIPDDKILSEKEATELIINSWKGKTMVVILQPPEIQEIIKCDTINEFIEKTEKSKLPTITVHWKIQPRI